ncbi:MAG TPA: undecaprenyl-diphosphate phosphatase [Anaerolineae bacterium]|nr:undecaprenyl-diphosphate phosphatase [Anaerolineae bacterium]
MNILQAFLLGVIQGATEFIPISSSGHLTLVPWLLDWQFDPVLKNAFDVMAHWGTLVAVAAVLWRDFVGLVRGGLRTLDGLRVGGLEGYRARLQRDVEGRLAWLIVIGSIPAALLGLLFEDFFETLFGTPALVSLLMLVTAGLLATSEWYGRKGRELQDLGWLDALRIGLGQSVAIAPGISRSGATIASGLLCGIERAAAARFSFLLSTPVILGAGVWQLKDLFGSAGWQAHLAPMLIGFSVSALVGYASIRFLLEYLRRHRLYPFAVYCLLVGVAGLLVSLFR